MQRVTSRVAENVVVVIRPPGSAIDTTALSFIIELSSSFL